MDSSLMELPILLTELFLHVGWIPPSQFGKLFWASVCVCMCVPVYLNSCPDCSPHHVQVLVNVNRPNCEPAKPQLLMFAWHSDYCWKAIKTRLNFYEASPPTSQHRWPSQSSNVLLPQLHHEAKQLKFVSYIMCNNNNNTHIISTVNWLAFWKQSKRTKGQANWTIKRSLSPHKKLLESWASIWSCNWNEKGLTQNLAMHHPERVSQHNLRQAEGAGIPATQFDAKDWAVM